MKISYYKKIIKDARLCIPDVKIKTDPEICEELNAHACYCINDDTILLRDCSFYATNEQFMHILYHELVHCALHPKRMNFICRSDKLKEILVDSVACMFSNNIEMRDRYVASFNLNNNSTAISNYISKKTKSIYTYIKKYNNFN